LNWSVRDPTSWRKPQARFRPRPSRRLAMVSPECKLVGVALNMALADVVEGAVNAPPEQREA
jgi:hypothetical protein